MEYVWNVTEIILAVLMCGGMLVVTVGAIYLGAVWMWDLFKPSRDEQDLPPQRVPPLPRKFPPTPQHLRAWKMQVQRDKAEEAWERACKDYQQPRQEPKLTSTAMDSVAPGCKV